MNINTVFIIIILAIIIALAAVVLYYSVICILSDRKRQVEKHTYSSEYIVCDWCKKCKHWDPDGINCAGFCKPCIQFELKEKTKDG